MPATILLLSANPSDRSRLDLDDEARSVQQIFRHNPRFTVKVAPAARIEDFQTHLRDRPAVVHFGGHGAPPEEAEPIAGLGVAAPSPDGRLLVRDDDGLAVVVAPDGLARLFG